MKKIENVKIEKLIFGGPAFAKATAGQARSL